MKQENYETSIRKNSMSLGLWAVLWLLSTALASFGPLLLWSDNKMLTIIAIAINAMLGIAMIIANIKHINGLDELQRKIQLDAMGIALGVGIVGGLVYSLLDVTNVISQDAEISFLVILIGLTYMLSIQIGQKKFK